MKRVLSLFLGFLVLFSTLMIETSTVRAEESCQYFIIMNNMTQEDIELVLSSKTWKYYTPVYTITGNKICFPTLKDFARFLAPYDLQTGFVFPRERILTSEKVTHIHLAENYGASGTHSAWYSVNSSVIVVQGYYWAYSKAYEWDGGNYYTGKVYHSADLLLSAVAPHGTTKEFVSNNTIVLQGGDTIKVEQTDTHNRASHYTVVDVIVLGELPGEFSGELSGEEFVYTYETANVIVTFSLKDALTGQSLSSVTVKEGDTVLGTIDDGQSLELTKGTHTLTFEKRGYWSTSITIDVQGDMSVSVELYPDSAAFMFKNFPSSIEVYENSIYELTFTLSPISTQATYNAYLSLSGLTNILEVRKNGQLISPESGKYYLGDISGDTQVSIKFKATTVGTKAFSIILTSNDATMSKTYTTSKQVTYEVVPLPFSIQLPDWTVGENSLRIAESSGQDMVLTLSLKDSEGNEVWSDSYSFGPYESHEFTVSIPKEGVYTLEIQFSGTTAIFDINVNPPIQLLTDTIKVGKGDVGTIQLLVKNPSSLTKYYEVVLTGGFIEGNITKAIAVAPASEKTVEIAFQVPKDVQFDAYDLEIKVLEGDEVQFKGLVHVMIDNSGFSLPIGSGGSTLPLALGALVLIGGIIYVLRRR